MALQRGGRTGSEAGGDGRRGVGAGCSLRQAHSIAAADVSFGRLLPKARVRSAYALLARGARVSEAAYAGGSSELSHFARSFKARSGGRRG